MKSKFALQASTETVKMQNFPEMDSLGLSSPKGIKAMK